MWGLLSKQVDTSLKNKGFTVSARLFQILWHLFKYLTKWTVKLRPSSVPEFMIFVYKRGEPFSVATPTRLVAMVTKNDPKLD